MCEWIERIPEGTRQNDGLETGLRGAYGRETSVVTTVSLSMTRAHYRPGYMMAFEPAGFMHSEQGDYGRSWLTQVGATRAPATVRARDAVYISAAVFVCLFGLRRG